jgi:hypothetical protein
MASIWDPVRDKGLTTQTWSRPTLVARSATSRGWADRPRRDEGGVDVYPASGRKE